METYINEAHVKGRVRRIDTLRNGAAKFVRLSVNTATTFTDRDGNAVVDITWHRVSAQEGGHVSLAGVTEGAFIEVRGRLRNMACIRPDGTTEKYVEILASELRAVRPETDTETGTGGTAV